MSLLPTSPHYSWDCRNLVFVFYGSHAQDKQGSGVRMNPFPAGPVSPEAGAGCAPVPRTRDGRDRGRRLQSRPCVSTKSEPETPHCAVKAVRVPSWLCCTPHTATVDCLDVHRYALRLRIRPGGGSIRGS